MAGTAKQIGRKELEKIWKQKGFDTYFLLKTNFAYSKKCVIIDKKTGKTVRVFDKNYDLLIALIGGYIPGKPWKITCDSLFGGEIEIKNCGAETTLAVDMTIDYVIVLQDLLPTLVGEELNKELLPKLRKLRKKIRE